MAADGNDDLVLAEPEGKGNDVCRVVARHIHRSITAALKNLGMALAQ